MITWRALPNLRLLDTSISDRHVLHVKKKTTAHNMIVAGAYLPSPRDTMDVHCDSPKRSCRNRKGATYSIGILPRSLIHTPTYPGFGIKSHITSPFDPIRLKDPAEPALFWGREERCSFQTISNSDIIQVYY